MSIRIIIAFALAAIVTTASADGDPAAGKEKSATCAACHGADGNSANPEWPKLAAQHAPYLYKQLMEFKSDKRENAVMKGMVLALSEQDMKDLAAFYATQSASGGFVDEALIDAGRRLFHGGNARTGVPACMGCHGPAGGGDPRAGFPRLAGQHSAYIALQLDNFRNEVRVNDYQRMMHEIAVKLSPAEVQAVSAYINGLY